MAKVPSTTYLVPIAMYMYNFNRGRHEVEGFSIDTENIVDFSFPLYVRLRNISLMGRFRDCVSFFTLNEKSWETSQNNLPNKYLLYVLLHDVLWMNIVIEFFKI